MDALQLGKTAYAAYFKFSDGKSLISGAPLPAWEDQAPNIQAAWQAAGQAAVDAATGSIDFAGA
jgi:hypothetical protein